MKAKNFILVMILSLFIISPVNALENNDENSNEYKETMVESSVVEDTVTKYNDVTENDTGEVNNPTPKNNGVVNNPIQNDSFTLKNGWIKENNQTYYYINNVKVKGFQTIEGKTYFFSNVNYALKSGMQYIEGKPFYLNNDGTVVDGFQTIEGKTYYFGQDHFAVKGFQTIEGKTYFFSNVNYALKSGMQYIEGKPFYLNNDGTVVDGFQTIEGKTYYYGQDHFAVKGFQKIGEKTYFFSNINYVLKSGWQSLNGNIFYLNTDGSVVYGNQSIEGRDYIFDENGFMKGLKYVNNKMYYYNPDGSQAKGIQRMAGRYYKFDEITGAFEKFVNQKIVIDVSAHQDDIDWNAVKNSGKVDAVILRIGYGVRWMDNKFLRNVNELNRLGIPYSVYLFSYAENGYEAGLEADNLINIVKNNPVYIASNLFSIYYDLEDWYISATNESSNNISKETYGNIINSFINKVTSVLGIKTRIYASKSFIENRFPLEMRPYVGWVAQWGPKLTYQGTYEGWQYTDNGSVPGIKGSVDMSIFYY